MPISLRLRRPSLSITLSFVTTRLVLYTCQTIMKIGNMSQQKSQQRR